MRHSWVVVACMLGHSATGLAASVEAVGKARGTTPVKVKAKFDKVLGQVRGAAGAGALSPFKALGGGVFEADYQAPDKLGPATVTIVVFDDSPVGEVVEGTVNVVEARKETVKVPGKAPIYVRVGETRTGPFHSSDGKTCDVEYVATGEDVILETAQGKQVSKLPGKGTKAQAVAFTRPERVRPGEATPAEVVFRAPEGVATTKVRAAAGGMGGVGIAKIEGSLVRFKYTVPSKPGDLSVAFLDDKGATLGKTAFVAVAGKVVKVEVKVVKKDLKPGEISNVSIRALDAEGTPVAATIDVEASGGAITPPIEEEGGLYMASLTAPKKVPKSGSLTVTAKARSAPQDSSVEGTGSVAVGGEMRMARVEFAPGPKVIEANQIIEVKAKAVDDAGNPVPGQKLGKRATHGKFLSWAETSPGEWVGKYQAGEEAEEEVVLAATDADGDPVGEQRLEVKVVERPPRFLVGPTAGFTSNFGQVNTVSLGAVGMAQVWGPIAAGGFVAFRPGFETVLGASTQGGPDGKLTVSRLPIHLRAGALTTFGNFEVHGGLQGGVTRLIGQLQVDALHATAELGSWVPEVGAYGGVGYKLGPGYLGAELRGTWASLNITQGPIHVKGLVGGFEGAAQYLLAF